MSGGSFYAPGDHIVNGRIGGGLEVGSRVRVRQGARTYTGGSLASFVYATTYTVKQVNGDRVVIGINGVTTAAVHRDDLLLI